MIPLRAAVTCALSPPEVTKRNPLITIKITATMPTNTAATNTKLTGLPLLTAARAMLEVTASVTVGCTVLLIVLVNGEISGEINGEIRGETCAAASTARSVALTGVDYLSVGALTHSAPVLDLGLDLR